MLPFLWLALPWARHILKEAPSWALFSSQVTGHVLFHTSYYVKQVLAATEVGGNPPTPAKGAGAVLGSPNAYVKAPKHPGGQ